MDSSILIWIVVAVAAYLLYVWIDRQRWKGRIKIKGNVMLNGGRVVQVESEGDHQRALARAAANDATKDAGEIVATLVAVPTDQGEPAIIVRIGRDVVGRLSHSAEKQYMPVMRRLLEHNLLGDCRATIADAGDAPADGEQSGAAAPASLVLRLDLATPDKAIPPDAFAETAAR